MTPSQQVYLVSTPPGTVHFFFFLSTNQSNGGRCGTMRANVKKKILAFFCYSFTIVIITLLHTNVLAYRVHRVGGPTSTADPLGSFNQQNISTITCLKYLQSHFK